MISFQNCILAEDIQHKQGDGNYFPSSFLSLLMRITKSILSQEFFLLRPQHIYDTMFNLNLQFSLHNTTETSILDNKKRHSRFNLNAFLPIVPRWVLTHDPQIKRYFRLVFRQLNHLAFIIKTFGSQLDKEDFYFLNFLLFSTIY